MSLKSKSNLPENGICTTLEHTFKKPNRKAVHVHEDTGPYLWYIGSVLTLCQHILAMTVQSDIGRSCAGALLLCLLQQCTC